jgi:hypothetical protein
MANQRQTSPAGYGSRSQLVTLCTVAVAIGLCAACNEPETPTSATTTATTTATSTVATPTVTEDFVGTVLVGSYSFYSFVVEQNGTVNVTLTGMAGTNVPSTVWMGVGIGVPTAEDCATTTSVNTQAAASAQLTGTYPPGTYCARVYDIGNLAGPAQFAVTIAHP